MCNKKTFNEKKKEINNDSFSIEGDLADRGCLSYCRLFNQLCCVKQTLQQGEY